MTTSSSERRAKLAADLAFWHAQRAQIACDRGRLLKLPLGGLIVVLVWLLVRINWVEAAGLVAASIAATAMGLYMTSVRHEEYSDHIDEAQAALAALAGPPQGEDRPRGSHAADG